MATITVSDPTPYQRDWIGSRRCRLLAILCLGFGLFAFTVWWNGPIRPLLFSATEVLDDYDDSGGGITCDFNRCIRARCSEEVFHRYARQQELDQGHPGGLSAHGYSWSRSKQAWWTPPSRTGTKWYYSGSPGGSRRLLAYADGCLYYDIAVW